jgi:hypothetical protein
MSGAEEFEPADEQWPEQEQSAEQDADADEDRDDRCVVVVGDAVERGCFADCGEW